MSDMLADAASWLTGQRSDNLSQTVTLHRGAKQTTGVKAAKAPVRSDSDPQFNIDVNHADWIVQATLYQINSAAVEPQKNDVIEEADGQKWQVLPLGNEPEARFSDQYGNAWRIHTKRIKEPD